MSKFSWLHFSDLHYHVNDTMLKKHAHESLVQFIKDKNINCDYLFLTGDLAHKGEYNQVESKIKELINAISFSNGSIGHVYWAVGNHDIGRGKIRANIIKKIRSSKDIQSSFQKALSDKETNSILCDIGMSSYFRNYAVVTGETYPLTNTYNSHQFISLNDINLIIINTCITSCDDADGGRLLLADPVLYDCFSNIDRAKPTVVLGHHGREFLHYSEYDNIDILFNNRVDLYLCGHSHRIGYSRYDNTNETYQLTCGGGVHDGFSKFVFMHGEYDSGKVKITPYSFSEKGSFNWDVDYSLHNKLSQGNSLIIHRLTNNTSDDKKTVQNTIKISDANKPHPSIDRIFDTLTKNIDADYYLRAFINSVEDYLSDLRKQEYEDNIRKIQEKMNNRKILNEEEIEMIEAKSERFAISIKASSGLFRKKARTFAYEKGADIFYSNELPYLEKIALIAHEIGHLVLHMRRLGFNDHASFSEEAEKEANYFSLLFARQILEKMKNEEPFNNLNINARNIANYLDYLFDSNLKNEDRN